MEGSEKRGSINTEFCQLKILPASLQRTAYIYHNSKGKGGHITKLS